MSLRKHPFLLRLVVAPVGGAIGGFCVSLVFLAIGIVRALLYAMVGGSVSSAADLGPMAYYVLGFSAGGFVGGLVYALTPTFLRFFTAGVAGAAVALRFIFVGLAHPIGIWDPADKPIWLGLTVLFGMAVGFGLQKGVRDAAGTSGVGPSLRSPP